MRKLTLTALILFSLTTTAYAQSAAERLERRLYSLQSMQTDFHQIVISEDGEYLQDTVGKMSLKRPGKFRWEVSKPTNQVIIADGKKLWHYDKDLEQITVKSLDDMLTNSPALLLSGKEQTLSKDYEVKSLPVKDDKINFVLLPKDPSNIFAEIKMTFVGRELQTMSLKDSLGQSTTVMFSNVRLNPQLSAEIFKFTPPEDVDVVRIGV